MHLIFVSLAGKKALENASFICHSFATQRKVQIQNPYTLVDLAQPIRSEALGMIKNDFVTGIPGEGAWGQETVKTMSTVELVVRNGFLLSEPSPHGMLEIVLQNKEDPL